MIHLQQYKAMGSVSDWSLHHSSDWDTDDELEMEFFGATGCGQVASSSGSSSTPSSSTVHQFIAMGFPEKNVIQAIKEKGEDDTEAILNTLLTYSEQASGNSPQEDPFASSKLLSLSDEEDQISLDDLSDGDSACGYGERSKKLAVDKDVTISRLLDMGYELEDALTAIEKCGFDAPLDELTDFICAAELGKNANTDLATLPQTVKKRKFFEVSNPRVLIPRTLKGSNFIPRALNGSNFIPRALNGNNSLSLPNQMIGFGLPGGPCTSRRVIPEIAMGPPYFYYENVALTPKGVWGQISRFLYDIEPEFVDSIHFSAAARKRGYIHNLPIENRHPLLPIPPKTIHEAMPETKEWWPSWDKRTKLNCLLTCIGSAQLTQRIRHRVEKWDHEPPLSDQKYVIQQCKKWNLIWVGKNKVAVLEPDEMEVLLGFPKNHTRGGGISRTDRYKSLGNSFQVDTVAYHLSVLKSIYPTGMNVLSLFSGIGGAEVSLHRLGIPLKNVVSVEISPVNQKIMRDWWEQTEQQGNLIHVDDVEKVDNSMISKWINEFNGFDLVIGGSPCNNLSGGNRRTRDGLEGEHSSLFYQYYRILDTVRTLMRYR